MRLEGKVAIVTGGSKGIGKSISSLFLKEGAEVITWDVLGTSDELIDGGGHFNKVDVSKEDEVDNAVDKLIGQFGRIDILINNAGITRDRTLSKMNTKEWQEVLDVNLNGVFNATQAVIPHMKEQRYGRIISASSVVGLKGGFGQGNYAASKAGIIGLTKSWSMELAKYNITVNCVAPGYIKSDMTDAIPDDIKNGILSQVPTGRIGQADEVAKAYLFLASEDASYVNGVTLPVDGGLIRF